ncbi:MAG: carboxymuconolactone decarboxylase family protein [Acidobacteria bacterium]|nr:carboxymuconolactone decarboxylase family protein [Acidobacteriota bacterium]
MKIQPVEKEQAGPARELFEQMEKKRGKVLNFFRVMAHKPEALTHFANFYGSLWAKGELSPKLKEIAYLRTSILNGCEY